MQSFQTRKRSGAMILGRMTTITAEWEEAASIIHSLMAALAVRRSVAWMAASTLKSFWAEGGEEGSDPRDSDSERSPICVWGRVRSHWTGVVALIV